MFSNEKTTKKKQSYIVFLRAYIIRQTVSYDSYHTESLSPSSNIKCTTTTNTSPNHTQSYFCHENTPPIKQVTNFFSLFFSYDQKAHVKYQTVWLYERRVSTFWQIPRCCCLRSIDSHKKLEDWTVTEGGSNSWKLQKYPWLKGIFVQSYTTSETQQTT